MNRRLTLKAERLTELGADELAGIAGGALPTTDCEKPTIDRCLSGYYPSLNAPCETLLRPVTPFLPQTH